MEYWSRLRDVYNSLPEDMLPAARWKQAYQQVQEEMGIYQEPGDPPSFDPPAQTPQQFAAQYADAVYHMMATHTSHLVLPANFANNWHQAILKENAG